MSERLLAWHWLRTDARLRFLPHTLVEVGQELHVSQPLQLCKCGLHASESLVDSVGHAPGPIACRVECRGRTIRDHDEFVAEYRRVLWMVDAEAALVEFSCDMVDMAIDHVERHCGPLDPHIR